MDFIFFLGEREGFPRHPAGASPLLPARFVRLPVISFFSYPENGNAPMVTALGSRYFFFSRVDAGGCSLLFCLGAQK